MHLNHLFLFICFLNVFLTPLGNLNKGIILFLFITIDCVPFFIFWSHFVPLLIDTCGYSLVFNFSDLFYCTFPHSCGTML